jgi:hypothetical protein
VVIFADMEITRSRSGIIKNYPRDNHCKSSIAINIVGQQLLKPDTYNNAPDP